jgi:hypothetical protein
MDVIISDDGLDADTAEELSDVVGEVILVAGKDRHQ